MIGMPIRLRMRGLAPVMPRLLSTVRRYPTVTAPRWFSSPKCCLIFLPSSVGCTGELQSSLVTRSASQRSGSNKTEDFWIGGLQWPLDATIEAQRQPGLFPPTIDCQVAGAAAVRKERLLLLGLGMSPPHQLLRRFRLQVVIRAALLA